MIENAAEIFLLRLKRSLMSSKYLLIEKFRNEIYDVYNGL